MGGGKWLVVDSCQNPKTREPIALEYLRSINVDVASDVALFAVTHWHDDHARGAAEIQRECSSAEFWCSQALRSEEFFVLTQQSREWKLVQLSSAVDEFRVIFDQLREQSKAPSFGSANQRLLQEEFAGVPVEVWSLSPSGAATLLAIQEIASQLATEGERPKRPISINPNHVSMTLWVRVGEAHLLLGADLQVTAGARGWTAVVNSPARPQARARVYKVAHHGSENGDHDGIWSQMLVENPIAVVTPMRLGGNDLPGAGDVERLTSRTSSVYCTSAPVPRRAARRKGAVERTIRETARCLETIEDGIGQVRLRLDLESWEETVEALHGAVKLP